MINLLILDRWLQTPTLPSQRAYAPIFRIYI